MLLWLCLLFGIAMTEQACPMVKIDAIFICDFNFKNNNSTCQFSSCRNYTYSGAQPIFDWKYCYASCCPGLVVPEGSTYADLQSCVDYYSSTPLSFYIIMIIVVLLGIIVCILLPCCIQKQCPFYRIRVKCIRAIKQRFCQQQQQQTYLHKYVDRTDKNEVVRVESPISERKFLARKNRVLLNKEKIDYQHSTKECALCTNFDSNVMLNCKHFFHLQCLQQQGQELLGCPKCQSREIGPMRVYCGSCGVKYQLMGGVQLDKLYICEHCDI